mgnify:CR=1 FL=1
MFIGIWLTTACNLKCRYCYEGDNKSSVLMERNVMEQCVRYINQIDDPLVIIQFHGGEPLLNYEMLESLVLSILKNKKASQKIMFGVTTNATLLDDNKIRFLSEHMDYGFSISIDGGKQVHDLMRVFSNGKGSYDMVISKVKKALKYNPNIRFRMTFTSKTVSNLCESIMHLVEIGARQIVSIPDYFDDGWEEETMEVYREQLRAIDKIYKEYRFAERDIEIALLENHIFKKTKCSGGVDGIHISPDGGIFPCIYVVGNPHYKIGTIYEGINESILKNILQVNELPLPECVGCNNYESCNSVRCRYLNEQLTGDCMKPSPVICAFENENIKFISG